MVSKPGPKPHQPTETERRTVIDMARAGVPWRDIAGCLRMSRTTLWRHFGVELRAGLVMARTHHITNAYRRLDGVDKDGNPVKGMGLLADDQGAVALFGKLLDKLWIRPDENPSDFAEYDAQFEDNAEAQGELRAHRALQEMLSLARRAGQGELARIIQDRLLEPVHSQEASGNGSERDEGAGE